jgi:hypothetical protein
MKATGSTDSRMPKAVLRRDTAAAGPMTNTLDKTAHFRTSRDVYQALTLIVKDVRKSVNKRRDRAEAVSCS